MKMHKGQAHTLFVTKAIRYQVEGLTPAEAQARARAEVRRYRELCHQALNSCELRELLAAEPAAQASRLGEQAIKAARTALAAVKAYQDAKKAAVVDPKAEPKRCYYIGLGSFVEGRGWQVGIVTEGQPDFNLTDWFWDCDYKTACKLAQDKNDVMGITGAEALRIVDSSITASMRRRPVFGLRTMVPA